MGSMAITPFRAIAGTGPVFLAFLIPHMLAGLTVTVTGAVVMVSPKGTRRHVRTGTAYFWAMAVLVATAAGLTAIRGSRDLPVFLLGLLALALASAGRHARRQLRTTAGRHPRTHPRAAGHAPHILAMTGSYTVMLTAFYVDNGKNLPLVDRLPEPAYWLFPAVIAAPLIVRSLRRHRSPKPPASGHQNPPAPGHQDDEETTTRTPAWTP